MRPACLSSNCGNVIRRCLIQAPRRTRRNSDDYYALDLGQGGLSLPDRDYYLSDGFATQRAAYVTHISQNARARR